MSYIKSLKSLAMALPCFAGLPLESRPRQLPRRAELTMKEMRREIRRQRKTMEKLKAYDIISK